jgi:VWFA-related protein
VRTAAAIPIVCLMSASAAIAQNPAPGLPPLVEKVTVSVTNVDATVLDRSGKPVRGLTRDDFRIYEDGVLQKITNFYAVENALPRAEGGKPLPVVEERFRRKALLVVDNNFIEKVKRDAALDIIQKSIDADFAGDCEWSVVLVGHGIATVQEFTSDKALIHRALDEVRGRGTTNPRTVTTDRNSTTQLDARGLVTSRAGTSDRAAQIAELNRFREGADLFETSLALHDSARAVIEAAHAYSAVPGKKIMVVISGGFGEGPSHSFDAPQSVVSRISEDRKREMAQMLETMIHEANAANFNIHVINARGVVSPVTSHDASQHSSAEAFSTSNVDSMPYALATQTGGLYLPGNRMSDSIRDVDRISSNYYSLGYMPGHFEDGKYHRIKVEVTRPGCAVHSRAGYADLSAAERVEQSLRVPMTATVEKGTLPVSLGTGALPSEGENVSVAIVASVPMNRVTLLPRDTNHIGRLQIYLSIFDDQGNNIAFDQHVQDVKLTNEQAGTISDGDFRYHFKASLPKGKNVRIVIAVRDLLSDEIGLATKVLTIAPYEGAS